MPLAVRISSYGCTREVWRALKKLELLSATPLHLEQLLRFSGALQTGEHSYCDIRTHNVASFE